MKFKMSPLIFTLLFLFSISIAFESVHFSSKEELENWEPPEHLKKNFPSYKLGYDNDGRPIWLTKYGKYDFRMLVEQGQEAIDEYDKYCEQWEYKVQKSIQDKSTPEKPVKGWVYIFDMAGYNLWQLGHFTTFTFTLKQSYILEKACRTMDYGFLINMNFLAENLIKAAKPFLGSTLNRALIAGKNSDRWIPEILKTIPRSQLPEEYGGYGNFTPVYTFG